MLPEPLVQVWKQQLCSVEDFDALKRSIWALTIGLLLFGVFDGMADVDAGAPSCRRKVHT